MRRPNPALAELLFEEPYLFDFFQAVRLLEKIKDGRGPVGHDIAPTSEAVRFVADVRLTFPPSSISDLESGARSDQTGEPGPPRMTTPFIGLVGATGALPTVYTKELLDLKRDRKSPAARDFLDLFHHRLVSLFYRAWEKYNVPSLFMRGSADPAERIEGDAFTKHLFDFVGLRSASVRDTREIADGVIAYYCGFFAQQHRPAVTLELLLADHFGQPTQVLSFVGQWLGLEEDQRSKLGRLGSYNALGVDTVVGRRVWDDQCKFRVRIGPLDFAAFNDFLPGGDRAEALMDLIRLFVRGELDFDVQLVLKAEDVPWCELSNDPSTAARLGQTSWLRSRDFDRDADDPIIRPRPLSAPRSVGQS